MASKVKQLIDKGLIKSYPSFVKETHYETIMGSIAYGVSNDMSDVDIYGFTIPPKNIVFPHLDGYIQGFGRPPEQFEQFIQHHINVEEKGQQRSYDIQIFNIVKYFELAMKANPNILSSLFTPINVVVHKTPIGDMVRFNRGKFLSKKVFISYKNYSYSQLHKCKIKTPKGLKELEEFEVTYGLKDKHTIEEVQDILLTGGRSSSELIGLDEYALRSYVSLLDSAGKRAHIVREKGADVKFLYHVVRLIDEVEQILLYGDVDLQRNKEQLKAIRRGDMSYDDVERWFISKENDLNKLMTESKVVPDLPDESSIKQLLLDCLEEYYGSLEGSIVRVDEADQLLRDISNMIKRKGY